MTRSGSGGGGGGESSGERWASRLEAWNKHMLPAARATLEKDVGKLELALLRAVAEGTDKRGRRWFTIARMMEDTRISDVGIKKSLARLATVGLLYYVKPSPHALLPWKFRDPKKAAVVGAWGVWIPTVACTKNPEAGLSVCAASIREHQAADAATKVRLGLAGDDELWPVIGHELDVFLAAAAAWDAKHSREARKALAATARGSFEEAASERPPVVEVEDLEDARQSEASSPRRSRRRSSVSG